MAMLCSPIFRTCVRTLSIECEAVRSERVPRVVRRTVDVVLTQELAGEREPRRKRVGRFHRGTGHRQNHGPQLKEIIEALRTAEDCQLAAILQSYIEPIQQEGQRFRSLIRLIDELSDKGLAKLSWKVLNALESIRDPCSSSSFSYNSKGRDSFASQIESNKSASFSPLFSPSSLVSPLEHDCKSTIVSVESILDLQTEVVEGKGSLTHWKREGNGKKEKQKKENEKEGRKKVRDGSGSIGTSKRVHFMKDLYTHVLSVLAKAGALDLSLQLMNSMKEKGIKGDVLTYNALLLAYCHSRRVRDAEALLAKMRRGRSRGNLQENLEGKREIVNVGVETVRPGRVAVGRLVERESEDNSGDFELPVADVASFNTLLRVYAGSGEWQKSENLLKVMVEEGVDPDAISFTRILEACERSGQWRRCESLVGEMEGRGVLTEYGVSVAMRAMGRAGQWRKGREMLQMLQKHKVASPKVQTYNIFLNSCRESGQWKAAMEAFRWMKESGLKPTEVTYDTIISVCRKAGQWKLALELFSDMENSSIKPSKFTLTELIMVYADAQMPERAFSLLDSVTSRGLVADTTLYNAAMGAFSKAGRVKETERCWEAMEAQGCKATAVSYNLRLQSLGKSGQLKKSILLFEAMKEERISPQLETYNILLDSCALERNMKIAIDLFGELQRERLRPDRITFNTLLKICSRCGQGNRAVEVYRQMKLAGVQIDGATLSVYLPALEASGLSNEALEVFENFQSEGLWTGPYTGFWYAKIIGACVSGKDVDSAMAVYEFMVKDKVEPWAQTFLVLLKGCETEGAWEQALRIIKDYRSSLSQGSMMSSRPTNDKKDDTQIALNQKEPGIEAYNLAIGACDSGGQPQEALKLFKAMQKRGVTPTLATFAVLVRALQNGGLWEEALEVYNQVPLSRNSKTLPSQFS